MLRNIPGSGCLSLKQVFPIDALDLTCGAFSSCEPLTVEAKVSRGINSVSVDVVMTGVLQFDCSRCLATHKREFNKSHKFNFEVKPSDLFIDIDQDLREEIMLDLPIKPLCKTGCKGLCAKCGEDLNLGKCKCKK
jgi:uncharacterized protein